MAENKVFTFNNVLPYHIARTLLVIIPCPVFYGALYYVLFKGVFRLSFVMFFFPFYFGSCYLILKAISVKLKIWFDENYFYIQKGTQTLKKNIPRQILKDFMLMIMKPKHRHCKAQKYTSDSA